MIDIRPATVTFAEERGRQSLFEVVDPGLINGEPILEPGHYYSRNYIKNVIYQTRRYYELSAAQGELIKYIEGGGDD